MSDTPDVLNWLKICDLAKQWPNLKGVHDLAMKQLMKATQDAEKQLADEKAATAAAAQRALNERYAKSDITEEAKEKSENHFNSETIQRRTDI